jgi:hypothetical protein
VAQVYKLLLVSIYTREKSERELTRLMMQVPEEHAARNNRQVLEEV